MVLPLGVRIMAKIGDRVQLTIQGGTHIGGTHTYVPDIPMSVEGTIVGERGPDWIVKLDNYIEGKNEMLVPKVDVN